MKIQFTTKHPIDNGEEFDSESTLRDFILARTTPASTADLIELLVETGVLDVEDVFEKFKAPYDLKLVGAKI